jgi:hypothetical protein
LPLLQVKITQERGGKSAQLLGRLDQPVQDRLGVDLKDPRRGTDTQALGQARQDAHDELDRGLFTMEERTMRLKEVAFASGTVELSPRTTTGMAIGAQVA